MMNTFTLAKCIYQEQCICYKCVIVLSDRIQSLNEKGNNSSIQTRRTRSGTNTDNYTELGLENMTGEPESQYESLSR